MDEKWPFLKFRSVIAHARNVLVGQIDTHFKAFYKLFNTVYIAPIYSSVAFKILGQNVSKMTKKGHFWPIFAKNHDDWP